MPHFEIHANDVDEAKTFYGGLFGWSFSDMDGVPARDYQLVSGRFIGGDSPLSVGILRRMDTAHSARTAIRGGTMTFDVEDCDASYAWALANGGAEALPPQTMPGIGRFAYVEDGQGNIVGFISPTAGED